MSKRDIVLLEDMQKGCERILQYTKDIDYDQFLTDIKTTNAVVRNIQIVGEAANQLSLSARQQYQEIEWSRII